MSFLLGRCPRCRVTLDGALDITGGPPLAWSFTEGDIWQFWTKKGQRLWTKGAVDDSPKLKTMVVEVKELKTERLGFIVEYEHEFDREFESGSITRGPRSPLPSA